MQGHVTQHEAPQETLSLLPALTLWNIEFSHATNTRTKLLSACFASDDDINFIEADILYSESILPFMTAITSESSTRGFAILGHSSSDLANADISIYDLLQNVLLYQKGVKIDIKDYKAIKPCLQAIQEIDENSIDGSGKASWRFLRLFRNSPSASFDTPAVVINADILTGTGMTCLFNSKSLPLSRKEQINEAREFIKVVGESIPYAIISLGWTTDGEYKEYSEEMIHDMEQVLLGYADIGIPFTLAIRASYVRLSIDRLLPLLNKYPALSFTIWSNCILKKGEEEWIRDYLPKDRTAYDLPRMRDEDIITEKNANLASKPLSIFQAAFLGAITAAIVGYSVSILLNKKR